MAIEAPALLQLAADRVREAANLLLNLGFAEAGAGLLPIAESLNTTADLLALVIVTRRRNRDAM